MRNALLAAVLVLGLLPSCGGETETPPVPELVGDAGQPAAVPAFRCETLDGGGFRCW